MGQLRQTLRSTMYYRLLFLMVFFTISAQAQNWSTFLDPSRAINWSSAGFSIPSYTAACSTQPSLTAGSSAASANATSIQNAVNSCDSTHNVVNIPAGTWYVTVIFVRKGNVVIRGAGSNSTTVIPTTGTGCAGGITDGICFMNPNNTSAGNVLVTPPSGAQQCRWTGGYSQGTTTITIASCGAAAPPVGEIVDLDQANDSSDNSGIYICDTNVANCGVESTTGGNNNGRFIGGVTHSQQQLTKVTAVSSLGGGSYSLTISPGVYFSNIRSGQSPGIWWFDTLQNSGVENLTIDGTTMSGGSPTNHGNIGFYQCYQCWVKGVRSANAGRHHVALYQSFQDVIRDSYFYGALGGGSQSYAVEMETQSGALVENNIFQCVTNPVMFGAGTGDVVDYNFSVNSYYTAGSGQFPQGAYWAHNAGNEMNLFEGNNLIFGPWGDDSWGSSTQATIFRSMSPGWQPGKTESTMPINARSLVRSVNVVGSVFGEPGYHIQYETYATSKSGGIGGATEAKSIYSLGWVTQDGACSGGVLTNNCDPLVRPTLMRWGNYDTVNAAIRWDTTEASPAAVAYINSNFTPSYFSSLAHALPDSLYYNSKPSWWPSSVAWPSIGPDVTAGNIGMCSGGTYAGAQATSSSQCAGGTLSTAWAAHVNAIPAQVCYLSVMSGPPDGSGSMLSFDASKCYASSGTSGSGTSPAPPTALTATVN